MGPDDKEHKRTTKRTCNGPAPNKRKLLDENCASSTTPKRTNKTKLDPDAPRQRPKIIMVVTPKHFDDRQRSPLHSRTSRPWTKAQPPSPAQDIVAGPHQPYRGTCLHATDRCSHCSLTPLTGTEVWSLHNDARTPHELEDDDAEGERYYIDLWYANLNETLNRLRSRTNSD
ncbi:hypothetical protein AUP68_11786 [Ilyonectria robusta]